MLSKSLASLAAVAVVVCLVQNVSSQSLSLTTCPKDVSAQENFDTSKYAGRWYVNRLSTVGLDLVSCYSVDYSAKSDGSLDIDARYTATIGGPHSFSGSLEMTAPESGQAYMSYKFSDPLSPLVRSSTKTEAESIILETDYENYSVMWQCNSIIPGLLNQQVTWVLTREQFPKKAVLAAALSAVNNKGLSPAMLVPVSQQC